MDSQSMKSLEQGESDNEPPLRRGRALEVVHCVNHSMGWTCSSGKTSKTNPLWLWNSVRVSDKLRPLHVETPAKS